MLQPRFRHGVTLRSFGRELVKRRFKQRDQRHVRHPLREQFDAGDVGRIVRRRQAVVISHRLQHALVQPHAAGDVFGDDGFETDGAQFAFARDGVRLFQLGEAVLNRLGIIGHALKAALVQKALGVVREIKQPPLERGRTDIGDENLHLNLRSSIVRLISICEC